jgi:transcriptional regulator with XRE-family HTH domain
MKQTPKQVRGEFGNLLRKHRTSARRSIADLARAVSIDETLLSRIETGTTRPPELSTLMRLTNALGIAQGSEQFEELWRLAEQERHPEQDATAYIASMKSLTTTVLKRLLEDMARTDEPSETPVMPVFVADPAALLARSSEEILQRGAAAMTVYFTDGTSKTWRVLGTTASPEPRDV